MGMSSGWCSSPSLIRYIFIKNFFLIKDNVLRTTMNFTVISDQAEM